MSPFSPEYFHSTLPAWVQRLPKATDFCQMLNANVTPSYMQCGPAIIGTCYSREWSSVYALLACSVYNRDILTSILLQIRASQDSMSAQRHPYPEYEFDIKTGPSKYDFKHPRGHNFIVVLAFLLILSETIVCAQLWIIKVLQKNRTVNFVQFNWHRHFPFRSILAKIIPIHTFLTAQRSAKANLSCSKVSCGKSFVVEQLATQGPC